MEKGVKMQVTLASEVAKRLDIYCKETGLKRSAVISFALNGLWKGERTDEK